MTFQNVVRAYKCRHTCCIIASPHLWETHDVAGEGNNLLYAIYSWAALGFKEPENSRPSIPHDLFHLMGLKTMNVQNSERKQEPHDDYVGSLVYGHEASHEQKF